MQDDQATDHAHDQVAPAFVAHATVLLAVNLTHELDPVLAGLLPERVPEADELLDDQVLVGQVIRAPRGEARLERAVQWFDTVWFELPDRADQEQAVRRELDRQRDTPTIFDLEAALGGAADLLETLAAQTAPFRDISGLRMVLRAVRRWQADQTRENLLVLASVAAGLEEPEGLPSAEVLNRIRFFAQEGSLLAGEYLALHFKPTELAAWDLPELTNLLRSRYPLLRYADVAKLVARLVAEHNSQAA